MIEGTWLVLRAAGLVLSLQAVGAALFRARFASVLERSAARIHRSALHATLAALAIVLAQLLFEPVEMAGEAGGLTDPAVRRLLLASPATATLIVRLVGVTCLTAGLWPRAGLRGVLIAAGSAFTLGSFLLSGHTAIDPHRVPLGSLLLLHVAIVAFWFGALQPLRQIVALESRATAAQILAAFSALAVWLVPAIALAGLGMGLLLLPDVAALLRPYGVLLLAKAALYALLLGLAALNRLRLVPQLEQGAATVPAQLRLSMALEYALICLVLSLTAVLSGRFSPGEAERTVMLATWASTAPA